MSSLVKATPANKWLEPYIQGEVVQLPSGNFVRLRPVALDDLIRRGEVPDLLSPIAARTLWEPIPLEEMSADKFKVANEMNHIISLVVPIAMLEPKVWIGHSDELPEGSIMLEHMSLSDKLAIFQLAIQPADVLTAFRGKQIGNVAPVSDDEDESLQS